MTGQAQDIANCQIQLMVLHLADLKHGLRECLVRAEYLPDLSVRLVRPDEQQTRVCSGRGDPGEGSEQVNCAFIPRLSGNEGKHEIGFAQTQLTAQFVGPW